MTDQPATDKLTTARKRPWPRTVIAALIALSGLLSIFYAGFLPVPLISDVPIPIFWQALGVVTLVVAIGVYLGRAWGRALAIVLIAAGLVLNALIAAPALSRPDPALPLISFAVGVGIDLIILWWLVRRWSAAPQS